MQKKYFAQVHVRFSENIKNNPTLCIHKIHAMIWNAKKHLLEQKSP